MLSREELAKNLFGRGSAEDGERPSTASVMYGTAISDSEDGTVSIVPDNAIVSAPDGEDNTIYVPTSPAVQEGDTVMLIGAGEGRQPMSVVSVIGSGDRTAAVAAEAKSAVDEAVEEVAEVKQDIADFKSGADVDYAIYSYVDDEIGEFSQTVSATYLSKTDAQTTYATQSQLTQTAEDITASVSQNYVTKTDAQTTYATKSELEVGLEGIELEVSQNYATKDEAATMGESSGEIVTVDSGARLRSLEVEGKSVQDGTPTPSSPVPIQVVDGANLCNRSTFLAGYYDTGGYAESSNARYGTFALIDVSGNADYTFTINTAVNISWVRKTYYTADGAYISQQSSNIAAAKSVMQTFTTPETAARVGLSFDFGAGNAVLSNVTNIMLNVGSTAMPYVPYGSLGLKVRGKNLLNNAASLPTSLNGVTYTSADNGGISAAGTPTANSYVSLGYTVLSSGIYTASMSGDVVNMAMQVWAVNGTTRLQNLGYALIGTSLTFDTSSIANCTGVEAVFGRRANNEAVTGTAYFQIESGSTATDYAPYVDSLTEIPLQGNVLASLPDGTKDVLTVDASGHVTIAKNIEYGELNGTENWIAFASWDSATQYCYYLGKSSIWNRSSWQQLILCSAFNGMARQTFVNSKPDNSTALTGITEISTRSQFATVDEFKQYLAANPIKYVALKREAETIDLGYITMPELADGCTVEVLASLTPTFGASWYTENGAVLTDFATKSELQVTADGISSVVSTKVGQDEVISKINQSAEAIQIEAERIEFDGTVVFNAIKSQTDAAYDANGAASTVQANLVDEEGERKAVYGTCSTAAGTAAKVVICANFQLFTGARITVKFSTASTVAAPTLNVNGTGAKAIWYNNAVASSSNPVLWGANATLNFVYDGTEWVLDEKPPSYSAACSTAASTRDKAATVAGALVVNGTTLTLNFSTANTYVAASVRINLSSTGATAIYYNRAATSSTYTLLWAADTTLVFVRQGAAWYLADSGMRKNITHISDNGVSIHAANNPTSNYIQLDSNGMDVYKGGSSVAQFGATARIGIATEPRVEIASTGVTVKHYGTGPLASSIIDSVFGDGGLNISQLLQMQAVVNGTSRLGIIKALTSAYLELITDSATVAIGADNQGPMTGADFGVGANGVYFNHSARPTETIGADLAITRVYSSYGFRVENAVFHATADMVVLPLQFASDSSIEFGFGNSTYVAATIPVAYAPKEMVRAVIFTTSDWSSVQIGWANIGTDGKIYLQAARSVVWFGQAVWIRE